MAGSRRELIRMECRADADRGRRAGREASERVIFLRPVSGYTDLNISNLWETGAALIERSAECLVRAVPSLSEVAVSHLHPRTALLAIALSFCAAGTVKAAVVNFEDYTPKTTLVGAPGQTFSTGGLSFTGKDYQYLEGPTVKRGAHNGTEILVAGKGTSITKAGGGVFVLHSIDLGQSNPGAVPTEVTLTRNFAAGGSNTEVVSLGGSFRTFSFDPTPLNSFDIASDGGYAAIDNIV